jgi:hypothetical protein
MKTILFSAFIAAAFLASSASWACSPIQKKQCQKNPDQCEAAGICQDAKAFDDEQFDKTAAGENPDMDEAASYGDNPSA